MLKQVKHNDGIKKGLIERFTFLKLFLRKTKKRTSLNYNELVRTFRKKIKKK